MRWLRWRWLCRLAGHGEIVSLITNDGRYHLGIHTNDRCQQCGETWFRYPHKTPEDFAAAIRKLAGG